MKLTGGLGNQLFQYVKGRALSVEKNTDLLLDTSWYRGRINRKYMLDNFNIQAGIANRFDTLVTRIFNKKDYIETDRVYDWQSEEYLNQVKYIILKEFTLKNKLSDTSEAVMQKIKSVNSVSIHLRGTDYVQGKKSSFHGACSKEYYEKAVQYMKNKVISPHFFIFTDDIQWAKDYIKLPEMYTLISNTDYPQEDLILMSGCRHNIIANSTFSWWGAWLNKNHQKIVISPQKWFNDSSINIDNLIPKSWMKM